MRWVAMIMIFEENIEKTDFLELSLTSEEMTKLATNGVLYNFKTGLKGDRPLNVFIRLNKQRSIYATE
jgi:hypothetical protein